MLSLSIRTSLLSKSTPSPWCKCPSTSQNLFNNETPTIPSCLDNPRPEKAGYLPTHNSAHFLQEKYNVSSYRPSRLRRGSRVVSSFYCWILVLTWIYNCFCPSLPTCQVNLILLSLLPTPKLITDIQHALAVICRTCRGIVGEDYVYRLFTSLFLLLELWRPMG